MVLSSIKLSNKYGQIIKIEGTYMIISFVSYSRQSAVVPGVLHDSQEGVILDIEIVFVVVEKFILLHTFHLDALQIEMTGCWILLACVERIEAHAVDKSSRLMHFFFAAEKVHS
jgi:hypothetical protein